MNAIEFGEQWLRAWNAHDVEVILKHFHKDVVFASPVAARLFPETGGVLRGRDALRAYWNEGIRRMPDLKFVIVGLYEGIDTLIINFRNHRGDLVNEVLIFDGELVRQGYGTYHLNDSPFISQ